MISAFSVIWHKWRSSCVLALRSLWLHKLRSMLSVLGIIIGTAAVIALMAFGKGSMEDALEDIRRQGTTNVIVRSAKPIEEGQQRRSWIAVYGLTWEDAERFKMIETVKGSVPMRIFPQEIRRGGKVVNSRLVATTDDYARINQFTMAAGRFLLDGDKPVDDGDAQRFRNVVVLGARIAEDLFPFEDPIGQSISMNRAQYLIVGVIKDRLPSGTTAGGESAEDYNRDVYMPISTCRVRFGERVIIRQGGSRSAEQVDLHQITLTIEDIDKVKSTGDVVIELLKRYHAKKDWDVAVPLDRLKQAEDARDRYNMLLVVIASISLLVGGIGIMNIMLATVTERTREIGIRRALGAKRRDITVQFIIEAVVQTSIGGILGTLLGLALVFGLPLLSGLFMKKPIPVQLHTMSIFFALAVAIAVGVLFGWYPARRASRLDPIEALRHN